MKTYQDRMRAYRFLLVMFAIGFILLSLLIGKVNASQHDSAVFLQAVVEQKEAQEVESVNSALRKGMLRTNRIAHKHFGVKALHKLYIKDGTLFVDMTSAGLNLYKVERDQVIGMTVDNFTLGYEGTFKRLGITAITVSVDGTVYKTYTF